MEPSCVYKYAVMVKSIRTPAMTGTLQTMMDAQALAKYRVISSVIQCSPSPLLHPLRPRCATSSATSASM